MYIDCEYIKDCFIVVYEWFPLCSESESNSFFNAGDESGCRLNLIKGDFSNTTTVGSACNNAKKRNNNKKGEKSEEKEKDQSTEGETPNPIPGK